MASSAPHPDGAYEVAGAGVLAGLDSERQVPNTLSHSRPLKPQQPHTHTHKVRASGDSKWGLWASVPISADQGGGWFRSLGKELPPPQLDTAQGPYRVPAPAKCPSCHSRPWKGVA